MQNDFRMPLVVLLAMWAAGYMFRIFLMALGKRELAALVKLLTLLLCVTSLAQVCIGVIGAITEYFDPLVRAAKKIIGEDPETGKVNFWDWLTRYPKGGK